MSNSIVQQATQPFLVFRPFVADFAIPIVLLVIGGLGKKLARGGPGWEVEDAYLGPDLCIAALSMAALRILELVRDHEMLPTVADKIALCAVLSVVTMCLYVFTLAVHQGFPAETKRRFKAKLWMGVVCNLVGVFCLASFLYLID